LRQPSKWYQLPIQSAPGFIGSEQQRVIRIDGQRQRQALRRNASETCESHCFSVIFAAFD
jgi:hypothetical protein